MLIMILSIITRLMFNGLFELCQLFAFEEKFSSGVLFFSNV